MSNPNIENFKDEMEFLKEEFKLSVDVQMHFNDMLMKMRTLVITFIITIFGAAAYLLKERIHVKIINYQIHPSAFIVLFGVILSIGVFVMDYFYYYKMLIGAVNRSYDIKTKFDENYRNDYELFNLPYKIRDAIGESGISKRFVFVFYGIIVSIGSLFMLVILFLYSV